MGIRKNIVVLITDTFRYDNIGDRAERPVRTPDLDRFAAERATEVERFTIGSFPTIPQRTDFATGVLGWPHYSWQPLDLSGPNHIAALLGDQGYATQLICDTPHLFDTRFHPAFTAAYQHRGQEGDLPLLHLNDPIEEVVPADKTRTSPSFLGHPLVDKHRWVNRYFRYEAETFAARTAGTAVRWLEENSRAGPFFLWVDLFDPHEPWDPPAYLVERYDPDYRGTPMIHPNYGPSSAYSEAELRNLWAHYAAEAELVDRYLGRILQKLDDLLLWDDTLVVVMSDHGMSLGEHARTGKSSLRPDDERYWPIYPEVGHALCLIAGAEVPRGRSLDLIAQPIDLAPTLCELAGVTVEPPQPFDGRSFAGAVLGGGGRHRDYAVSGCFLATDGVLPRRATTPFLVTDRWGYAPVGAYGRPELYDLTRDPLAGHDVAADNPGVASELRDLFLTHLAEHRAPAELLELWQEPAAGGSSDGAWAIDYPEGEG